jgi:uncharacterized protein YjbI with pentapeptide repeats
LSQRGDKRQPRVRSVNAMQSEQELHVALQGGGPSVSTAQELLAAYEVGSRAFPRAQLDNADFSEANLRDVSFYMASLRCTNFDNSRLTHVQFKGADLTDASLSRAAINASDLIGATFKNANLKGADFTGASMNRTNCMGADMRKVSLGNAHLDEAILTDARLDGAHLSATVLSNLDIRPLCDAKRLRHGSPSYIESRTVIKSYQHPNLKQFMLDCGVPPIFVEYMIDCARAIDESLLRSLMQSTFISYGGPDEAFARKLYEALKAHGVVTFFFPVSATLGERIDSEVFRRLQEHDRVILVCSRNSLDRPGVLNEIQETFDREARDGAATYLLPVTLDDYVFTGWRTTHPELAERVGRRVVGDFRGTARNKTKFNSALGRLLDALKTKRPFAS